MTDIQRRVIRSDGSVIPLPKPEPMEALRRMIGADTLGVVTLKHLGEPRQVLLLDDEGYAKEREPNAAATALYLANCRPGATHQVLGDCVVCPDSDFGPA